MRRERGAVGKQAKALRNTLVVSEISLALLLLMGAGLFVRSLSRLCAVSLGFSDDHILVADLPVPPAGAAPGRCPPQHGLLREHAAAICIRFPACGSVAASSFLPVSGQGSVIHFNIQGRPPRNASEYIMANYRTVSSEYFQALRIPLLQGRWIEDSDREKMPPVVVINQAMAKTYFGDQSPLGKKMQIGATPDNDVPWMMVVGVVGNVKQIARLRHADRDVRPFRQANEVLPVRNMSFVMRTEVDPRTLIPDCAIPCTRSIRISRWSAFARWKRTSRRTLRNRVPHLAAGGLRRHRAADCGRGVYGVMAYATVQRSSEMAIRLALGCSVERIFMLVVTDGLRLTLIGVAIGTVSASRWAAG